MGDIMVVKAKDKYYTVTINHYYKKVVVTRHHINGSCLAVVCEVSLSEAAQAIMEHFKKRKYLT